jgi:hypothetical protein
MHLADEHLAGRFSAIASGADRSILTTISHDPDAFRPSIVRVLRIAKRA